MSGLEKKLSASVRKACLLGEGGQILSEGSRGDFLCSLNRVHRLQLFHRGGQGCNGGTSLPQDTPAVAQTRLPTAAWDSGACGPGAAVQQERAWSGRRRAGWCLPGPPSSGCSPRGFGSRAWRAFAPEMSVRTGTAPREKDTPASAGANTGQRSPAPFRGHARNSHFLGDFQSSGRMREGCENERLRL